jgi:hypothetical protein
MPDIDIDFANRDQVLSMLTHRVARLDNGKKHNTGVYVTEIPHNPVNSVSTLDYKTAEDRGYFKLDFLNVHIYRDVKNEDHLYELINREPLWELLDYKEFVDQVFHLTGNADIVKQLAPRNIEQLAATLAIIRPSKRYLLNSSWDKIFEEVWVRPSDDSYYFKKSHAFSYAMAVIVHMNLICEQVT